MRPVLCIALVLVWSSAALAAYLPGEVLVRLDRPDVLSEPSFAAAVGQLGLSTPDYFVQTSGVPSAGLRADRNRCFLRLRSERADFDAPAAAAALAGVPGVRAACVNGLRHLFFTPNDTYFSQQWSLQPGNPAGIKVAEAWDVEDGDPGVVIAIMDTGVDWSNPDLGPNVRLNPGEVAGNGVDDDANGYIDDVRGWDFGNHDNDARPHTTLEQGLDVGFHGSHCAGIAAAATNNAAGVAGAGFRCQILPLKIVNTASEFTDAAVVEAFLYAIDNGADVVSMSFGGPDEGGAAAFFQTLIDDAIAANVVCVAAAGNNNDASLMYPAACAGVISVGATNESGARASFSTYGNWVTVNAPGEHIWSTIQSNYSFDFLTGLLYQLLYGWDGSHPYMYCDGTSMACPLVAGVCGLLRSAAPGLAPAQVRQTLVDTGDVVSFDQPLGRKVNTLAALQSLQSTGVVQTPRADGLRVSCAPNPFNPRTTVRFTLPTAGAARLTVIDARGRCVRTLLAGDLPAGEQTVVWNGMDDAGRPAAAGVYVLRLLAAGTSRETRAVLVK